jgi:hypothetical protein
MRALEHPERAAPFPLLDLGGHGPREQAVPHPRCGAAHRSHTSNDRIIPEPENQVRYPLLSQDLSDFRPQTMFVSISGIATATRPTISGNVPIQLTVLILER